MKRYMKHPDVREKGLFVLEHIPTGKLYAGTSLSMQRTLDELFYSLKAGSHPCKALQKLFTSEPDFKVHLTKVNRIDEATKLLRVLRASKPLHLLIGHYDHRGDNRS